MDHYVTTNQMQYLDKVIWTKFTKGGLKDGLYAEIESFCFAYQKTPEL